MVAKKGKIRECITPALVCYTTYNDFRCSDIKLTIKLVEALILNIALFVLEGFWNIFLCSKKIYIFSNYNNRPDDYLPSNPPERRNRDLNQLSYRKTFKSLLLELFKKT